MGRNTGLMGRVFGGSVAREETGMLARALRG